MKIDQSLKTVAPSKARETKGGKSNAQARRNAGSTVQDQVDLTGNAERLRNMESRLADLDITDPQKVEAIRLAIAEGRFKVDPDAVADSMIKEALDMLSRISR